MERVFLELLFLAGAGADAKMLVVDALRLSGPSGLQALIGLCGGVSAAPNTPSAPRKLRDRSVGDNRSGEELLLVKLRAISGFVGESRAGANWYAGSQTFN